MAEVVRLIAGLLITRQVERFGGCCVQRLYDAAARWTTGNGVVRGLNWSTRCSSSEVMGRWDFMGRGSLRSSDF